MVWYARQRESGVQVQSGQELGAADFTLKLSDSEHDKRYHLSPGGSYGSYCSYIDMGGSSLSSSSSSGTSIDWEVLEHKLCCCYHICYHPYGCSTGAFHSNSSSLSHSHSTHLMRHVSFYKIRWGWQIQQVPWMACFFAFVNITLSSGTHPIPNVQ